jgi:hypothetical protein
MKRKHIFLIPRFESDSKYHELKDGVSVTLGRGDSVFKIDGTNQTNREILC